ncbi:MAG: flavin monoamine oxidase family protein [Syntrophobacteraceae bacterium]
MHPQAVDTLIIGGGLSGIYAAHLLRQKHRSFVVLEARERLGGRILSPEYRGFFSDLGPSWYWPSIHHKMSGLIEAMGLHGYRQFEEGLGRFQNYAGTVRTLRSSPMEPPSWRLSGGMIGLITKLREDLPENTIRLNHAVCRIERLSVGVRVAVGALEEEPRAWFTADKVILAMPPRLAAATILFEPELSHELTQAMLRIGTWMAGQAKFWAFYEEPFWRHAGLSGEGFSELGPLGEIHDGSNNNGGPYGLSGFVGIPAVQRHDRDLVTGAILSQLADLFGRPADRPVSFFYQDWARERFTATSYDQRPMVEHPLYHPPAGKTSFWNGAVHFAGTETADLHGGYLEGAVSAAERAVMNVAGDFNP